MAQLSQQQGLVHFNVANNFTAPWCARDLAVVLLRK